MKLSKKITAKGRFAMACTSLAVALAVPAVAEAAPVRLMVDPGHGGKDPGVMNGRVAEKHTNLQISKYVVQAAKRQGWAVGMTRNTDVFVDLTRRSARATEWGATDMVSVHSNSYGKTSKGNMTIYRGTASGKLGANVMSELDKLTPYRDIGNKADSRGLAVLRTAKAPTIIAEVLSFSSPQELKRVKDPKFQREAAEAIVRGVAKKHGVKYVPPTQPKPVPAPAPTPAPQPEAKPATPTAQPATTPAEKPEQLSLTEAADARTIEASNETTKAVAEDKPEERRETTSWLNMVWELLTQ